MGSFLCKTNLTKVKHIYIVIDIMASKEIVKTVVPSINFSIAGIPIPDTKSFLPHQAYIPVMHHASNKKMQICFHRVPSSVNPEDLKRFLRQATACPIQKINLTGRGKAIVYFRREFSMDFITLALLLILEMFFLTLFSYVKDNAC